MGKTCAFITLGCKVNQYDTQIIREALHRKGYQEVSPEHPAELYVINTCAVTSTSERKSRQEISKAIRRNKGAGVVVTGCYAKADPEALLRIKGVRRVIDKEELCLTLGDGDSHKRGIRQFHDHSRAFLKIEDGCEASCSYCIVPTLRGKVRSRPKETILEEARRLVANGYKEIVLTGVRLSAYGRDLKGDTLLEVAKELHEVNGLYRIRLSSLEAAEVSEGLIDIAASSDRLCPHFHLPLQSGDDYILKKMNRHYTVGEYLRIIYNIKNKVTFPSFSSDVIVGFPGEGIEHFRNTLEVCREVGFSRIHIFPFSPRRGTPAAQMSGRCSPVEMQERKRELETLARGLALEYKRKFLGKDIEILVEESPSPGEYSGYSERYIKADFSGQPRTNKVRGQDGLIGKMVKVRVEEVFPEYVRASLREQL
ncbi:MAG TPA: MiaB/RimO family radical SAM methylthiotransferase [Candidatus Hypogeohydataceae bacterium YC40]